MDENLNRLDENLNEGEKESVVHEQMDLKQFLRRTQQDSATMESAGIAIAQGDEVEEATEAVNQVEGEASKSNAMDLVAKMRAESTERMKQTADHARHKQTGVLVDAAKDTTKIEPLRNIYQSDQKIEEFNEAMAESGHNVEVISKVDRKSVV